MIAMTEALQHCLSTSALIGHSAPCDPIAVELAADTLLPTPTISLADVGQLIAQLETEMGFQRRKSARDARDVAQSAVDSAQKRELAEMRKAADERYAAAKVEAWTKIVTGAGTVGAMALGDVAAKKWRNSLLEKSGDLMKDGVNRVADGASGLVSSGMRHEADRADEAATAARYAAKSLEKLVEEAVDDERAAKESVRKALDFLREYESTRSQSQSAALHRM